MSRGQIRRLGMWVALWAFVGCGSGVTESDDVHLDVPDVGPVDGFELDLGVDPGPVFDILVDSDAGKPDSDAADLDAAPEEVDLACEPGYGEFGCSCTTDDDCASNYCVDSTAGKVCTTVCTGTCEAAGWTCAEVKDTCPDCVYICVYQHQTLCAPCRTDAECKQNAVLVEGTCLSYGNEGSYCGTACELDAECPDGFYCSEETLPSGQTRTYCRSDNGRCECSPYATEQGLGTGCAIQNAFGTCSGDRYCTEAGLGQCDASIPSKEKCNLADDDCDGETDEGYEGEVCAVTNEFGTCAGLEICIDGEAFCEGREPAKEICDGQDNNCNGQTDETFLNTDADPLADCVDPDDDNDGVFDDGDASGTVGDNPCPNGQTVSCDDNCRLSENHFQADLDLDGKGDACDCDADGDNFGCGETADCDDLNKNVNPAVNEGQPAEGVCTYCNAKDDDCDGQTDEGCFDANDDGVVDCLAADDDADGVVDGLDNCPKVWNPHQEDLDGDHLGDVCDDDKDNDGFKVANDCDDMVKTVFPGAYEACNGIDDNCNSLTDEDWLDTDHDKKADCVDPDDDDDGVLDDGDGSGNPADNPCTGGVAAACDDNCGLLPNANQADLDGDLLGDLCDPDLDDDGKLNELDNCPAVANPQQADLDFDGLGDACDSDVDGDTVSNDVDNCPWVANLNQTNTDGALEGDACDADDDDDGVPDDGDGSGVQGDVPCQPQATGGCDDNCRVHANAGQADNDLDGVGDACDTDDDNDGVADDLDNCVLTGNGDQLDTDGDQQGDACDADDDDDGVLDDADNCRTAENAGQLDTDGDLEGDACDLDDDADGVLDAFDNCPVTPNQAQQNSDTDGLGDACDLDDDDDGVPDDGDGSGVVGDAPCSTDLVTGCDDNCRTTANANQIDTDVDTAGDACDLDDDDDDVPDVTDNCVLVVNSEQENADGDKQGDACDDDDDNDGVLDDGDGSGTPGDHPCQGGATTGCDDNCRTAANANQKDTDGDLEGDACDLDDDADGVLDDGDESGSSTDKPCAPGQTVGCDDNCRVNVNTDQADNDGDGKGDLCDGDDDNDTIADDGDGSGIVGDHPCTGGSTTTCDDNCVFVVNSNQIDTDGDTLGNECDPDDDNDTVPDDVDNCDLLVNPEQADLDGDLVGDVCDDDDDDDGVKDTLDNCPRAFNPNQADSEPEGPDGLGDECDDDDDNDGVLDDGDSSGVVGDAPCALGLTTTCDDNCRFVKNPAQADNEPDGQGDACDSDDDNDGVLDGQDNCPFVANSTQANHDTDAAGDACDSDDDNDGILDDGDGSGFIGDNACTNGATTDCDDNCPFTPNANQADFDKDGRGDTCEDDNDGDGDPDVTDCHDTNPLVYNGAPEYCNGKDDDCDTVADEENAVDCHVYFYDKDGDGYGLVDNKRCLCDNDPNYLSGYYNAPNPGDCLDTNGAVNPGLPETCDATLDENCSGQVNEGCNDDGDQYCDASMPVASNPYPAYCIKGGGDCNDLDANVYPTRIESCNDVDDDCDSSYDEGCDDDGDDFCDGTMTVVQNGVTGLWPAVCPLGKDDCDDTKVAVNPLVVEVCDGTDNDCNAQVGSTTQLSPIDEGCDDDGDFFCDANMTTVGKPFTCVGGGGDCNDDDATVHPGQGTIPAGVEVCDNVDNNCNATVDDGCDDDADDYCDITKTVVQPGGYWPNVCPLGQNDCNDAVKAVNPGATEICDDVDNNCSGSADEGCDDDDDGFCDKNMTTSGYPAICSSGGGDCDDGRRYVYPNAPEYCDGIDNNCDTKVDTDAAYAQAICLNAYGASDLHATFTCGTMSAPDEYVAPYQTAGTSDGWECKVNGQCTGTWIDLDGLDQNGCECSTVDTYANQNFAVTEVPGACAQATALGTLSDGSASEFVVTGKIHSAGDADWYKVVFEDGTTEKSSGNNFFSAQVLLENNAGGNVVVDVYDQNNACPTAALQCNVSGGSLVGNGADWTWSVKGRLNGKGESPCNYDVGACPSATPSRCDTACCDRTSPGTPATGYPNGGDPNTIACGGCSLSNYSAARSFCNANAYQGAEIRYTRTVFIHVRPVGAPSSCAEYQLRISNNKIGTNYTGF